MYKQVIVVNKELHMSTGKMAAMVAHGSISFLTNMIKKNINPQIGGMTRAFGNGCYYETHPIKIEQNLYEQWIDGNFTKIILEAENQSVMESIIHKAKENGMYNQTDFFNVVDESTEFNDIPRWAVIAFKPMDAERINKVTGDLNLYGYENSSLNDTDENKRVIFENGERIVVEKGDDKNETI